MELDLDVAGKIAWIARSGNDAHKLIEECMLAANVCTAEFPAQHRHPALYRVHEGPTPGTRALRDFLASCALSLPGGDDPTASDRNRCCGSGSSGLRAAANGAAPIAAAGPAS
jgi:ribonuclease R